MKATVSRKDFLSALIKVTPALPSRTGSLTPLQNVLLEFKEAEGAIKLSATDLEVCCIVECPATIKDEGTLAVNGIKLLETIKELPETEISLEEIERNTLNIKAKKMRFNLRGIPRDEYPSLPSISGDRKLEISSTILKDAIKKTIIASSTSEARTFLNGIYVTVENKKIRFVATDGHRLALYDIPAKDLTKSASNIGNIVPARILIIAANALITEEKIQLIFSDTHIIFSGQCGLFSSRLIMEKFPDYKKIIPKSSDKRLIVSRQPFLDHIKAAGCYSDAISLAVTLSIKNDKIIITSETPEAGDAHLEIDAKFNGASLEMNFNNRYLQDVLKVINGDNIIIDIIAEYSPVVITSEEDKNYSYLLMPLRN